MASTAAKTIVATGASSGLGFEVVKQLLEQAQPYKFILGVRDIKRTETAYEALEFDRTKHSLTILPVELSNMKTVKSFAQQTLEKLGQDKIDYLMINAGMIAGAEEKGPHGSKWSSSYLVNHLSQHYLMHLLRAKLEESKSRIVFVSSGAVRGISDPSTLDKDMLAGSGAGRGLYSSTKFTQLLGAHWWRRQLQGVCNVVAVSPGLIPSTGIDRSGLLGLNMSQADAKDVPTGAKSILEAFWRTDFPEDPEQMFLTSWGEWWPKDVYGPSLDEKLQDKWSPSQAEIEKEEGVN